MIHPRGGSAAQQAGGNVSSRSKNKQGGSPSQRKGAATAGAGGTASQEIAPNGTQSN